MHIFRGPSIITTFSMDLTTKLPAELCCEVFKEMMPQGSNRLLSLGVEKRIEDRRYIPRKRSIDHADRFVFRLSLSEEQRVDISVYMALRNTQHPLCRLLLPKKPFALSLNVTDSCIGDSAPLIFSKLPWHLMSEIQVHISQLQTRRNLRLLVYGIPKIGKLLESHLMSNSISRLSFVIDGVELVSEDVEYTMLGEALTGLAGRFMRLVYGSNSQQRLALYNAA